MYALGYDLNFLTQEPLSGPSSYRNRGLQPRPTRTRETRAIFFNMNLGYDDHIDMEDSPLLGSDGRGLISRQYDRVNGAAWRLRRTVDA
jgi:hypothetical protein